MIRLLLLSLFSFVSSFAEPNDGYSWKACERKDLGNMTVPFYPDGTFRPECAPDVLYSWHPRDILPYYFMPSSSDQIIYITPRKQLFTWRTPFMTIYYGDMLLRIKLKKGVSFILRDIHQQGQGCGGVKPNTVVVGYSIIYNHSGKITATSSEYMICSPDVIESWSHDTPEALKEIESEYDWVMSHDPSEYDLFAWDLDYAYLGKNLDFYRQRIQSVRDHTNDAEIIYSKDSVHNRLFHFSSRISSYFNPSYDSNKKTPQTWW